MYILFILWLNYGSNAPRTSVVAEFNSLNACQSAGKAIAKESENYTAPSFMLCAEKGKSK